MARRAEPRKEARSPPHPRLGARMYADEEGAKSRHVDRDQDRAVLDRVTSRS